MKALLVSVFLLLCAFVHAQSDELLSDSLTNKKAATWYKCNTPQSTSATQCYHTNEYVFKRDNTGKRKVCINGKWVENDFTWQLEKKEEKKIVVVTNNKPGAEKNRLHFVIQLMNDVSGRQFCRLKQEDFQWKETDRYCKK